MPAPSSAPSSAPTILSTQSFCDANPDHFYCTGSVYSYNTVTNVTESNNTNTNSTDGESNIDSVDNSNSVDSSDSSDSSDSFSFLEAKWIHFLIVGILAIPCVPCGLVIYRVHYSKVEDNTNTHANTNTNININTNENATNEWNPIDTSASGNNDNKHNHVIELGFGIETHSEHSRHSCYCSSDDGIDRSMNDVSRTENQIPFGGESNSNYAEMFEP